MLHLASPLALHAHPRTPAPMIRSLDVSITRLPEGAFSFIYRLFGDMARLSIPLPRPANKTTEPCEGLWEHTCFEVFVANSGKAPYREFNFSPSGQWAAYDFLDYRKPSGVPTRLTPPRIIRHLSEGRLELDIVLVGDAFPDNMADADLEIGLCAVIESTDTQDGARSYWSLRHLLERPDFHQREGFDLRLPSVPPIR